MAGVFARMALLVILLLPLGAVAEIYRYTNESGQPVLDRQGVPPQFIGKGYQVLNEQGRVIQVVPPAPSAAERQRLAEEKARANSDAQLLQLYSSQEDVDLALERKLAEIDAMLSVVKGNQQSLGNQQDKLQKQAAELERAGREVPPQLVSQIDDLKLEKERLDKDVARFMSARAQAQASFTADRARLGEILGRQQ